MEAQQLVRVLVAAAAGDNADVPLQALRRAGISLYARDIDATLPLDTQLAAERWHLILAYTGNPQMPAELLLQHLVESRQDIPCLLVATDKHDISRLARLGAAAIYLRSELKDDTLLPRFVYRAQRELLHLQLRREHRQQAIALGDTEHRYQQLLMATSDAITCVQQGMHLFCNPAYLEFLGHNNEASLLNTPFLDLIMAEDVERARGFLSAVGSDSENRCSLRFRQAQATSVRATVQRADVSLQGRRCLQLRISADELGIDCRHDSHRHRDLITGLRNQQGMIAAINHTINEAVYDNTLATLMVISLGTFEDTLALIGRADTNLLLAEASALLQRWIPPEAILGRISEAQFAILLPGAGSSNIHELQRRLGSFASEVARLTPRPLAIDCNYGMTVITDDAINAGAVLARANHQRLQYARRQQHGSEPDAAQHRDDILQSIRRALAAETLIPAYQPTVSLLGDAQERYEVRIRISHGERVLYPVDFLELASQQGLGEQVDRAVINIALRQLLASRDERLLLTVNLTQCALLSPQFLPWLAATLRQQHLSARQLTLQVSEIDIASAPDTAIAFCRQLEDMGLCFSLNHFGCALDPARLLSQIHCDYAKLDPSLLRDIDIDAGALERLRGLISALHARGVLVIAPMIERIELLPLLWQCKVNFVQGNSVRAPGENLDFIFLQDEDIVLQSPPQEPSN